VGSLRELLYPEVGEVGAAMFGMTGDVLKEGIRRIKFWALSTR